MASIEELDKKQNELKGKANRLTILEKLEKGRREEFTIGQSQSAEDIDRRKDRRATHYQKFPKSGISPISDRG